MGTEIRSAINYYFGTANPSFNAISPTLDYWKQAKPKI